MNIMSDIEDIGCTSPEIREKSVMASLDMLPRKSREKYERQHQLFLEWCAKNHITEYSENVVMEYFADMAEKYSPPTMWSYYSMLKATLNVINNVDIGNYKKLVPFLKQKSKGYIPKRSKTLSQEEVINFLLNAPDSTYLMMKVCTIFGIAGACHAEELSKLSVDEIEDKESILIVQITKTNKPRTFIVTADFEGGIKPIELYRKYLALRPSHVDNRRFFLSYRQAKCTIQPVGIHTIGGIPTKIASYLNLPDPSLYTGHCFRRTSATLFANACGSKGNLKRHGGWKYDSVTKVAKTILGSVHQEEPTQLYTFLVNEDADILQNCEKEEKPDTCLISEAIEKENSSATNIVTNTSKSFSVSGSSTSGAPAKLEEIENPDWVPTQNMGYDKQSRKNVGKKLIKTDSQMDNYVKLLSTPKSHLSEAKENKPQLNLVADFMKATFVSDLNDAGKNGSSLNNTNNIMIVSENPPDWSVKEEPKEIETNDNFLHSEVRDEFPQLMNAGVLKCRTCLSVIDSTSSYILSTVCDPDNFTRTIKDMITSFIPQMADTLPDDDLICSRCLESIKFCVKFITNCLNVEAKLQEVYDIRQLRDEYYGITPAKNNVPDVFQHVTLDHSYITKRKSDNKPAPAECTIDSSGIDAAPPEQENVAGSEQLNLSSVGFVCPKCNKEFQSSGQLDVHLDEVHSKETTVTSPEKKPKLRYGCIYCDKSFTTKFVCKIHLERDHKDKNMGHKTYFCKECMLDCETLSNLLDHNHAKHGFRCTICSKRFSSRASLLTHKEIHPNECFCETCGKAFKSKNDLRIHSYRHKQRITCVCDQCGRTCQSKETLLYHMKTHKTDNLYMCEICSRRFVKRSTLIVHQRLVHEKVRDHECTVCGIKFGMKMTLDKHYAVKHSTLKPHQCEICGLRFGIINYLRKHKLSSHGSSSSTKLGKKANGGNKVYNNTKLSEFKCKFCNLTFESIKSRDNHEKSHENASDEQRYEDCEELNTKENVDEHLPNPNLELDVSQADEEVTSDQDLEDADAV